MWIAERFGWTLEYVDGLGILEAYRILDICQAADRARADEERKLWRRARRRR